MLLPDTAFAHAGPAPQTSLVSPSISADDKVTWPRHRNSINLHANKRGTR